MRGKERKKEDLRQDENKREKGNKVELKQEKTREVEIQEKYRAMKRTENSRTETGSNEKGTAPGRPICMPMESSSLQFTPEIAELQGPTVIGTIVLLPAAQENYKRNAS